MKTLFRIKLYEGKNFSFRYHTDGTIGEITTSGQTLTFNYCDMPKLKTSIERLGNQTLYERELNIEAREKESYSTVKSILNNYYGWHALIKLIDGNEYLIPDPFILRETNENYQLGVNYQLNLNHFVPSNKKQIAFFARNFLTADQTDITVDSTEITADQTIQ